MNDKLLKKFSSGILISDVISYIDAHPKEFEKFAKKELNEKKEEGKDVFRKLRQQEKAKNET